MIPNKITIQNKTAAPNKKAIIGDISKNIQILSVIAVGSNIAIVIKPIR